MAEPTKKLPCSCEHKFQDEKYGKGIRLHNYAITGMDNNNPGWRCTVCTKVKPV